MKKIIISALICSALILAGCGRKTPATNMYNNASNSGETIVSISTTGGFYTNDQYGFMFYYPKNSVVTNNFRAFYNMPVSWMVQSSSKGGVPVISVVNARMEHETSYPREFNAETRIGVSTDPGDVATCLKNTDQPDQTGWKETINDIEYMVYPIQDAAMMHYLEGMSYRTVHNNTCYAIEQVKTGSSYHEEKSADDIPDTKLDSLYNELKSVIETFDFTK